MTTYVDTSVLVKLLVDEPGTDRAQEIWRTAASLSSSVLIRVEARAALAAAVRAGRLNPRRHDHLRQNLRALLAELNLLEVQPGIVELAAELSETERLRAYDAVHLASALDVGTTVFGSADLALCDAAGRQGLHVANPLDERRI